MPDSILGINILNLPHRLGFFRARRLGAHRKTTASDVAVRGDFRSTKNISENDLTNPVLSATMRDMKIMSVPRSPTGNGLTAPRLAQSSSLLPLCTNHTGGGHSNKLILQLLVSGRAGVRNKGFAYNVTWTENSDEILRGCGSLSRLMRFCLRVEQTFRKSSVSSILFLERCLMSSKDLCEILHGRCRYE